MRLKISIILVIIGTIATFSTRLLGTFNPRLLQNSAILKSFGIISLLSILAIIAFFIFFLIDFVKKEQVLLKIGSILMIIGSSAIFLLFLKAVFTLFRVFPQIYYFAKAGQLEAVVPCVNAAFALFFFIAFLKETLNQVGVPLKLATILIIASALTNLVLKSVVMTNFFSSGGFNWFISLFAKHQIIIAVISIFWFLTSLFFYIMLYREQE